MHPHRLAWRLLRELGPTALFHYSLYQLQLRSGWLKTRTPVRAWRRGQVNRALPADSDGLEVESRPLWVPFAPKPEGEQELATATRAIAEGVFPLFGLQVELGFPPDWRAFAPLAGQDGRTRVSAEQHWADYDLEYFPADVKLLWEPSRFGWAFILARQYLSSGDRKVAQTFGKLLGSWLDANPLNSGPHWVSAQEVALRGLALVYSRFAVQDWLEENRELSLALMELIAGSADRVSLTLSYARAQNNNHRLSEAAFLYSAGSVFPGLAGSERWGRIGRGELAAGFRSQVDAQGGYTQHSVNYQRLALELGLWCLRVSETSGEDDLQAIRDPLKRMADYLAAVTDPVTGQAPNLGPNDGALLIPRPGSDFKDLRPTLQAASAILSGEPRYAAGPWDDLARWLGVDPHSEQGSLDDKPNDLRHLGDLAVLQSDGLQAILRCATFRSRPGHADQLHLSAMWRGEPLLLDPGTYLYSGDPPWDNSLRSARVHNTVSVGNRDQMTQAGRFLYLDWAQGEILGIWQANGLQAAAGRHDGYSERGVIHQRTLVLIDDHLLIVIDDLLGSGLFSAELAWLLPDSPWKVDRDILQIQAQAGPFSIQTSGPIQDLHLVRAGERVYGPTDYRPETYYGWYSPTYAHKVAALHWRVTLEGRGPLRVETRLTLGPEPPQDLLELVYREAQVGRPALDYVRCKGRELRL